MKDKAYDDMGKITELNATTPGELLQRARIKDLMNDSVGCIDDLDKCISMLPTFMEAYFLRGKYLFQYEKYNKAIQDLNIYLLSNDKDADAFVMRGECYGRQGDYSLAASDYTQAFAIESDNRTYYFDRGFFYIQLEEYADAKVDFKKAIYYAHDDIKLAYFNLGIAEYNLDNKKDACDYWSKSEEVGMEYLLKYCQ